MWKGKGPIILSCLLAIIGISCLIAGVVFLKRRECANKSSVRKCAYSNEAKRSDLPGFFLKVQETYYELHPENIARKPGAASQEIRKKFMPYDPSPWKLKKITDKSRELLQELQEKRIDKFKLKPRERKGLSQMIHFLSSSFGTPYSGDYYAGDFLLGPTMFCLEAICYAYSSNVNMLNQFKLSTVADIDSLMTKIEAINHTFIQYKANLIYGVKAGMVRSTHPCKVGVDTLLNRFRYKGQQPRGIAKDFLNSLETDYFDGIALKERQKWFEKRRKTVNESIYDHIFEFVGKPLYELVTYLKTTYLAHCAPSDISSGFATIPLTHIYVNRTKTNMKTKPFLPDGSPLNGSIAYKTHILPFYTTTNITPDEVHALGHEMVAKLYSQILELARDYTNNTNNETARDELRTKLSSMYYANDTDIPEIESNGTAFARCKDVKSAKKHCPKRWKIIQEWFDDVHKIMSHLDGETVNFFHFVGNMHTTPNCPVQPKPNFNKNMAVASYRPSYRQCSHSASYFIPFFLTRPGPKFSQWSVNSHEARPGHHTQVQGNIEHFQDSCGGVIGWIDDVTYYTAFSEGWGLYAENPLIAEDTHVYDDKPLDKYGMLRGQLWRALRLVVDTGLHFKKFSRQEALKYFKDYAWEDSDVAQKEVTRYQSNPGQATTYTIGQLHLIKLRARAKEKLGLKFNLKDFHYYLLKDGTAPLNYLTESIEDYIRCTNYKKGDGCEYVIAPREQEETAAPPLTWYDGVNRDDVMDSYY